MTTTTTAAAKVTIEDLPVEVIQHCLTFSDIVDVCAVERTDKYLHEEVVDKNDLWEQLIERDLLADRGSPISPTKKKKGHATNAEKKKEAKNKDQQPSDGGDEPSSHPVLDASAAGATLKIKRSAQRGRVDGSTRRGHIVSVKRYRDRRLKELYQMVYTGKFVERRFEDRPVYQRVLIVVGSVILSPLLILYLAPKISKAIYREGLVPATEYWDEIFGNASTTATSFDAAAHSWVRAKHRSYKKSKRVPFKERPLWCKVIIVLFTIVSSPYWLIRYGPSLAKKTWKKWWAIESCFMTKVKAKARIMWTAFVNLVALPMYKNVLKPTGWAISRASKYTYHNAIVPTCVAVDNTRAACWRGLVKTATYVWEDVCVGTIYEKILVPTGRTTKTVIEQGLRFLWKDVCVGLLYRRMAVPATEATLKTMDRIYNTAVAWLRLVDKGAGWVYEKVIVSVAKTIHTYAIKPAVNALVDLGRKTVHTAHWTGRQLVRWARATGRGIKIMASYLYTTVLRPLGRRMLQLGKATVKTLEVIAKTTFNGLRYAVRQLTRAVKITSSFFWQRILCPIGKAIRQAAIFLKDAVVLPTWRGIKLVAFYTKRLFLISAALLWFKVLCPVGRFVKLSVVSTVKLGTAAALLFKRGFTMCAEAFWHRLLCPIGRGIKAVAIGTATIVTATYTLVKVHLVSPTISAVKHSAAVAKNACAYVAFQVIKPTAISMYQNARAIARFIYVDLIVATGRLTKEHVLVPTSNFIRFVVIPNVKATTSTCKHALLTTADQVKQGLFVCYEGSVSFMRKITFQE